MCLLFWSNCFNKLRVRFPAFALIETITFESQTRMRFSQHNWQYKRFTIHYYNHYASLHDDINTRNWLKCPWKRGSIRDILFRFNKRNRRWIVEETKKSFIVAKHWLSALSALQSGLRRSNHITFSRRNSLHFPASPRRRELTIELSSSFLTKPFVNIQMSHMIQRMHSWP